MDLDQIAESLYTLNNKSQVTANLIHAYAYINDLLDQGKDLFTSENLLELNTIVLCGISPSKRAEAATYIHNNRKRLQKTYRNIRPYADDPYCAAAKIYADIVSTPQMFGDGNCRTALLAMNYLLCERSIDMYVPDEKTFREFCGIYTDLKFSRFKWKHKKRLANFLRKNIANRL